jgi:guanine deaminase
MRFPAGRLHSCESCDLERGYRRGIADTFHATVHTTPCFGNGVGLLLRIMRGQSKSMDNPFMARAIQLSVENVRTGRGGPFGAVIVKEAVIIAEATNQVSSTSDPTAHAEVLAIRGACKNLGVFDLQGCEIYTSCEPCPMCLGAIYWARLTRVYFANTAADASNAGFDDSAIYREIAQSHAQRQIPMIQMMRKEALAAFREWKEKPNKIAY